MVKKGFCQVWQPKVPPATKAFCFRQERALFAVGYTHGGLHNTGMNLSELINQNICASTTTAAIKIVSLTLAFCFYRYNKMQWSPLSSLAQLPFNIKPHVPKKIYIYISYKLYLLIYIPKTA